jgi:DNA-binding response OmpR family regulator
MRAKTILLVEDEAVIALNVSMTLKRYGFTVIIATNGE